MLGRALSFILAFGLISQSAMAANHSIHLTFKKTKYTWTETKCFMKDAKGANPQGANFVIETVGVDANGAASSLRIELMNFRTVMKNTPRGADGIFEMDDKTVGNIEFVDQKGKKIGDVDAPGINSNCHLSVHRDDANLKHLTLKGNCVELGDLESKSGPRTSILIDEHEPISCQL